MKIKPLHPNFQKPVRSTSGSGAYDLFMPEGGCCFEDDVSIIPLGFAAEVPAGYVALLLPRSGVGFKNGLELNNTVGVIDSDFRGEWKAAIRLKANKPFGWEPGDRLLQVMLVPVATPEIELIEELSDSDRGEGGFGSTGK